MQLSSDSGLINYLHFQGLTGFGILPLSCLDDRLTPVLFTLPEQEQGAWGKKSINSVTGISHILPEGEYPDHNILYWPGLEG